MLVMAAKAIQLFFKFLNRLCIIFQPKCDQYWPMDTDNSESYSDMAVRMVSEDVHPDFTLRHFEINKVTCLSCIRHFVTSFSISHDLWVNSPLSALLHFKNTY